MACWPVYLWMQPHPLADRQWADVTRSNAGGSEKARRASISMTERNRQTAPHLAVLLCEHGFADLSTGGATASTARQAVSSHYGVTQLDGESNTLRRICRTRRLQRQCSKTQHSAVA
jgi:hypothetical protein